jgi:peptidoglycan/LPS O-acetylase OafA/YrhL
MTRRPQTENIQIVDLLRSLSILVVLISHFAYFVPEPSPLFRGIWDTFRGQGRSAVTIFFVVSGFLITRIIDLGPGGLFNLRPGWFYIRRVGRLLPLFFLQIFLGICFIGIAGYWFQDHSLNFFRCFKLPQDPADPSFWASLLTLVSFSWISNFFKGTWMGIGLHWSLFWSLAIEEQFYLFYPWLLKFPRREKVLAWILLAQVILFLGLSGGGACLTPPNALPVFFWSDVWCYGAIALGALLYLTCKKYGPVLSLHPQWNWIALGAGGLAILIGGLNLLKGVGAILSTPIMDFGVFLVLLGGIHLPFFESAWFKPFALPGKYCYGIYLLHVAVLYFLWPILMSVSIQTSVFVSFGLYTLVVTCVATLSYRYFEAPGNRAIQKRFAAAPH